MNSMRSVTDILCLALLADVRHALATNRSFADVAHCGGSVAFAD